MVKGTNHVFPQWVVHPGFSAHGRIHLGKQGSGDLDERHSTLITGRCKTGHVTDNAATQGYQGTVSIKMFFQQGIKYFVEHIQGLVLFTIWKNDVFDLKIVESRHCLL